MKRGIIIIKDEIGGETHELSLQNTKTILLAVKGLRSKKFLG